MTRHCTTGKVPMPCSGAMPSWLPKRGTCHAKLFHLHVLMAKVCFDAGGFDYGLWALYNLASLCAMLRASRHTSINNVLLTYLGIFRGSTLPSQCCRLHVARPFFQSSPSMRFHRHGVEIKDPHQIARLLRFRLRGWLMVSTRPTTQKKTTTTTKKKKKKNFVRRFPYQAATLCSYAYHISGRARAVPNYLHLQM